MQVEIEINKTVEVEVDVLREVLPAINELPLPERWNTVAQVLNGVELEVESLTVTQRIFIRQYLERMLAKFPEGNLTKGL